MGLLPLFLWCRWTLVWQFFLYDWLCCWTYLVTRNSARTLAPFVRISNNSIQNVEILTSFFKQSIQCYVCIRAHICTCTSMGMPYHLWSSQQNFLSFQYIIPGFRLTSSGLVVRSFLLSHLIDLWQLLMGLVASSFCGCPLLFITQTNHSGFAFFKLRSREKEINFMISLHFNMKDSLVVVCPFDI